MADDVEMIPIEAAEPPKVNPLAAAEPKVETLKLNPMARKAAVGGTPTATLKPGLRLPPKPGMATGLKLPPKPGVPTGLKLPPKPGMATGLKLPPKPGTATADFKPGLKLPTTPLKPGVGLPPKPVIRKPGATVTAMPLPKPVAVDAQGIGKLPTVEAKAVDRADATPVVSNMPKPLEALKSVTQKLKGLTQEIPQQAILHKTGIIADGAMSEGQKEAAKHKTARISLSDAMGVAPVKNENAPMKTIRIKRPIDISGATKGAEPASTPPVADLPPAEKAQSSATPEAPASTVTQRKTLKISRPSGAVRPSGKFGIKRPSQAATVAAKASAAEEGEKSADGKEAPVADIADIPEMPVAPIPKAAAPASDAPSWVTTLSTVVQLAACVAIGALAWFLYQNTQTSYF